MQRVTYAHKLDHCYDLIPQDDALYTVDPQVARIAQEIIHPDISFHWVAECAWPELDSQGDVQVDHEGNIKTCGHTRMGAMRRCPYHTGQNIAGYWAACIKRPTYQHVLRANGDVFRVYEWHPLYVGWLPPVPLTESVLRRSRITYAGPHDAYNIWNGIQSDRERYRQYWRDEYYHFTMDRRREIQDDIGRAMHTGFGRNPQISTFVESQKRRQYEN